jgi:hypothetical protein
VQERTIVQVLAKVRFAMADGTASFSVLEEAFSPESLDEVERVCVCVHTGMCMVQFPSVSCYYKNAHLLWPSL